MSKLALHALQHKQVAFVVPPQPVLVIQVGHVQVALQFDSDRKSRW